MTIEIYDSSVPDFNKFRVPIVADEIDLNDVVTVAVTMPRQYSQWFLGMASLLSEVNLISGSRENRQKVVDIYSNEVEILFKICGAVAACIDDGSLDRALLDFLDRRGFRGGGTTASDEENTPPTMRDNPELISNQCSQDTQFAIVTGLVDFLNTLIQDFIDVLVASQNTPDRFSRIISGIPIIGQLPIDEIINLGSDFIQDLEDNYQAAYTAQLRDTYRCDLFCLVEDCTLNFNAIAQYFAVRAGTTLFQPDAGDFFRYLAQGTFSGVGLVDAAHGFVMGALAWGSGFLDISPDRFVQIINALSNDTDSDWTTLCDPCGNPFNQVVTFDANGYQDYAILEGVNDVLAGNPAPSVVSDRGQDPDGLYYLRAQVRIDFSPTVVIDGLSADFYSDGTNGNIGYLVFYYDANGTQLLGEQIVNDPVDLQWYSVSFTNFPTTAVAYLEIQTFQRRINQGNITGLMNMDNIRVNGESTA